MFGTGELIDVSPISMRALLVPPLWTDVDISTISMQSLVDTGCFDLISLNVLKQMGVDVGQLRPSPSPLVGFSGKEKAEGAIVMSVRFGAQPFLGVEFTVIDSPMAFNAIIGRPTQHILDVVVSTRHLRVKFRVGSGVGQILGALIKGRPGLIVFKLLKLFIKFQLESVFLILRPTEFKLFLQLFRSS